jgi:integrase/recombinase XerD
MTEGERSNFELLIERFVEYLGARNYSPKTRVNYRHDVRAFVAWLAAETPGRAIGEVTPAHVRQYQMALYGEQEGGRRLSVRTQGYRIGAVRCFFRWLVDEQALAYNPAASVRVPKQGDRLPRSVLTKAEARRLLDATPMVGARDTRDRAILEVLYATGIRRAELVALSIYDLDVGAGRLLVRAGKGNQDRVVPLTETAREALTAYLDRSRPRFAREAAEAHLFVSSRSGGPLRDSDIPRIVEKAARRAGISKHVTPHTLRHSCATHLLAGRADLRQIQKLLGHRRLSSTEVYTRVEVGDLAEVVARCHPRSKPVR